MNLHCPKRAAPNLEYDDWYGFLGKKEMVGALLSRLCHHCHTIRIEGPSLRTPTLGAAPP